MGKNFGTQRLSILFSTAGSTVPTVSAPSRGPPCFPFMSLDVFLGLLSLIGVCVPLGLVSASPVPVVSTY